MAAALIGCIGAFEPSLETLTAYLERLDQYLIANDIGECASDASEAVKKAADRKKVAVIISVIGSKTYSTLRDLCSPSTPKDKSFDEICQLLKSHYKPKNLEVAGTYKFHMCVQGEQESIADYSTRLRRLATDCNFGTFLTRALRDQFVSGIRDEQTKKKLLSQDNPTFEDAMKLAIADEAAKRETQLFQKNSFHYVKQSGHSNSKRFNDKDTKRSGPKHSTSYKSVEENKSKYVCFTCGGTGHARKDCKYKDKVCHKCNVKGHLAKVCKKSKVNLVESNDNENESDFKGDMYTVFEVNSMSNPDIKVPLKIEGLSTDMQLDTGCAFTLAPKTFYERYCKHIPLKSTEVILSTYTGELIHPLGEVNVDIEYANSNYSLPLLIVKEGTTPLFGRNWLRKVKLHWEGLPGVNSVTPTNKNNLNSLLQEHEALFDSGLGLYTGPPEHLKVKETPKFHKARPVPYALRAKVEKALIKMESEGVIKKVTSAACAAPIVVVGKKDTDDVRICGDFSVTYNKCADVETYPLPRIEDIHEAVRGCKVFSILDMSQAYHQIPISEESQQHITVNTHLGLFSFTRLPNGIHSGPAIFQRVMDNTLAGLPKTICYIDDILVAGTDEQDHLQTLAKVFERLSEAGFKLNKRKCQFGRSSVKYLGHVIDGDGLHPTEDKLKAVQDAPRPKDVTALKSFLGLLMFYSRFLPNHSTVLAPLNELLKKDVEWKWTNAEDRAFENAKKLLLNSQTLVHYDDTLPLYLACDASSYGAGAVLNHYIDNEYRPVAFASCSLTPAQRNYSQLDKEAFSIIFGLKRFHQYLSGRQFTIITDHRPLLSLFAPDKPVPLHVAARLQRWSLILQSYHYNIEYRNTTAHLDADFVSRLPLPETWEPQSQNVNCFFLENEAMSYVSSEMIKKATCVDPCLSKVMQYTMTGWPHAVDPSLLPFKNKSDGLTVEQGCLLWGLRVIVPTTLRDKVLQELHETHPGMTRMKSIARSYVWWPNIDSDIEKTVKLCHVCQVTRADPAGAPVHPWCYPTGPWQRLHIDFKGPVLGRMFLVVVDAYSKYPEVVKMSTTTAIATIKVLRDIFSRHGLPETIVSDNGPQFTSEEFQNFCSVNGIIHRRSAPYKPSTNGQAERIVQVLKTAITQASITKEDIDSAVARHMLVYRNTPHTLTGESPSMLLMKRKLRTRLDLLKPSIQRHVQEKQTAIAERTANRQLRKFQEGETVMVKNYGKGEKWLPGKVIEVLGTRNYMVNTQGQVWKRHVDQLLERHEEKNIDVQCSQQVIVQEKNADVQTDVCSPQVIVPQKNTDVQTDGSSQQEIVPDVSTSQNPSPDVRRYPTRSNRGPPAYMKDFVT